MPSNRDRLIEKYNGSAKQHEPAPFVAQLTAEENGMFTAVVHGREYGRPAVPSNEFAFGAQGAKVGDYVIMIASDKNDMPVIVGLSPWIV